ncbi:MAG: DUF4249 domain-containing protein [Muribaculaceae bacterium]|nr:DUF4249 domain-containing protein [Muribaculaceae bacterium]
MRNLKFTAATLLLLTSAACEKELDFKYLDIEPLTVIEGELTPDGARIGITLTTPMDEPMNRSRLTDAAVSITDLTDGSAEFLSPDADGFYTSSTPGIPGHRYRLAVERLGSRYEAETMMYPPVEILSLEFNWIHMPYDDVAVLQSRFTDNPATDGDCYWVKLFRNGEIYSWAEMDDRSAVDGVCTYFTMTSRRDTDEEDDDEVLFDGDVMTCTVSAITREMHDYLEALQNDSNGPAMFTGDRCLGYFTATSPVSAEITFRPDEIPEYE